MNKQTQTGNLMTEARDALELVLKELATEIDLHYEDDDFFALTPTVDAMRRATGVLELLGGSPPEAVTHVFARYNKSRN